jgi:hypothetical protein
MHAMCVLAVASNIPKFTRRLVSEVFHTNRAHNCLDCSVNYGGVGMISII